MIALRGDMLARRVIRWLGSGVVLLPFIDQSATRRSLVTAPLVMAVTVATTQSSAVPNEVGSGRGSRASRPGALRLEADSDPFQSFGRVLKLHEAAAHPPVSEPSRERIHHRSPT